MVRIQSVPYVTHKIGVNRLFMLLVRLPVNDGLLVVKFWGSQKLHVEFWLHRGRCLDPHVVQRSSIFLYKDSLSLPHSHPPNPSLGELAWVMPSPSIPRVIIECLLHTGTGYKCTSSNPWRFPNMPHLSWAMHYIIWPLKWLGSSKSELI